MSNHKDLYQDQIECEVCREALRNLFRAWTSPEAISYEQEFLIEATCPQMPEPAGCSVGVLSWWEKIAKLIWSDEATYFVCNSINSACDLPGKRLVIKRLLTTVAIINLSYIQGMEL